MQPWLNKLKIKTNVKIQGIDIQTGNIYEFQSIKNSIQNLYNNFDMGLSTIYDNIRECLKGNKHSYQGFTWEYIIPNILDDEIWASIHPKLMEELRYYEISTKGRVKYPSGKITYGHKDLHGYMIININNKNYQIHRLIALVYLSNNDKKNKTLVNHIDEKKIIM